MSDNWVVATLEDALSNWNDKLAEIWSLVSQTPESFRGGEIWTVIVSIHNALVRFPQKEKARTHGKRPGFGEQVSVWYVIQSRSVSVPAAHYSVCG